MVTLSTHSWNFGDTVAGISCLMQSRTVTPLAPSTVEGPISKTATVHNRAPPMTAAFLRDSIPGAPSIATAFPLPKTKPATPAPRRLVEPSVSAGGRSCARPADDFSMEHYKSFRLLAGAGNEYPCPTQFPSRKFFNFAGVQPRNPHFLKAVRTNGPAAAHQVTRCFPHSVLWSFTRRLGPSSRSVIVPRGKEDTSEMSG